MKICKNIDGYVPPILRIYIGMNVAYIAVFKILEKIMGSVLGYE